MFDDVSIAVITTVLSLLSAAGLALLNNWISVRAGVDENLRTLRLEHYPRLWAATAAMSCWPRVHVSRDSLEDLHRKFRTWYYEQGGLFLSELARARYGDLQELIAAFLVAGNGHAVDVLSASGYSDLMNTASALRTALTEDLDTRRRKSILDKRRRSRWHAEAAKAAKRRLARATSATNSTVWRPDHPETRL